MRGDDPGTELLKAGALGFSTFKSLVRRLLRRGAAQPLDLAASDAAAVARVRARGVTIGEGCRIYTTEFSTEPYLVSIGDRVGISGGVKFLTHDGAAHLLRHRRPMLQFMGRITVGNDCFIGENALLLPGTRLGAGCIITAGTVVMGEIPANSVVVGNPGRVIGRASLLLKRAEHGASAIDSFGLPEAARRQAIERHLAAMEPQDEP